MANCVFVQAGQCGNQLGHTFINEIYSHLTSSSAKELGIESHLQVYFRERSSGNRLTTRSVCLDTEPKVIHESISKANDSGKWGYDAKSIAYRHGGAGNNWALGYQMTSGEFLETSLNCIRRELEHCDYSQTLVFMHSVAGGTGSGLGTHITEACYDAFPHATRMNIAITPYHFGEVVVQHYNAMLCLSKICTSSHGVLVFENETAQLLCRTMRAIDRPTMTDINNTIAYNLMPLFLPKYTTPQAGRYSKFSTLLQDVPLLCSHPGYRFLDIKTTPQTSSKGVEFTYDSWYTLVKTLQLMQLTGSASERQIRSSALGNSPTSGSGTVSGLLRSLASSVVLYGVDAQPTAGELHSHLTAGGGGGALSGRNSLSPDAAAAYSEVGRSSVMRSTASSRMQHIYAKTVSKQDVVFSQEYLNSHSTDFSFSDSPSLHVNHSPYYMNGYQRSSAVLSNNQAILPILQRASRKAAELYQVGGYTHQYFEHGLEQSDFQQAFHTVGGVINNYLSL